MLRFGMMAASMKKVGDRLGADAVALGAVSDALLHRRARLIHVILLEDQSQGILSARSPLRHDLLRWLDVSDGWGTRIESTVEEVFRELAGRDVQGNDHGRRAEIFQRERYKPEKRCEGKIRQGQRDDPYAQCRQQKAPTGPAVKERPPATNDEKDERSR